MAAEDLSSDDQEKLQEALKKMEKAFEKFHSEMNNIKLEQKEIAHEIRKRIDQEKIDQIRNTLQS
jgi:Sec-independent protein translocase protein TatA